MGSPALKRAIVIGGSSGLGYELVRQLAEQGAAVAVLGRREAPLQALAEAFPDQVIAFPHDVTQFEAVPELFLQVTLAMGGLDAVFYVAGQMPTVEPDEYCFAKDYAMLQVNDAGAVAWLNEAAIRFSRVGAGTIVGISSFAGERGRAANPGYNASKAYLTSYLESLRNRLSPQGVRVTTIKPGPLDTDMAAHVESRKLPVESAAQRILACATSGKECFLSPVHRVAAFVIRHIPSAIFRRLRL